MEDVINMKTFVIATYQIKWNITKYFLKFSFHFGVSEYDIHFLQFKKRRYSIFLCKLVKGKSLKIVVSVWFIEHDECNFKFFFFSTGCIYITVFSYEKPQNDTECYDGRKFLSTPIIVCSSSVKMQYRNGWKWTYIQSIS